MKNAIIFHGAGNNSEGNWFPWLKKELEQNGYLVWSPDMPESDEPKLKKWMDYIFSRKDWKFDNDTTIIGHSSGATFTLRLLERLPNSVKIHKVVLVSCPVQIGTKVEYFPYKRDLVKEPFNWNKIKSSCDQFIFFGSDNDKYECGIDQARIMQEHVGGEVIEIPHQGHFNLEASPQYRQFPKVLEKILS